MELLVRAYEFAADRHRGQRRKDAAATPYINHPIKVAALLTQAGITDVEVIIAGILHDTIEDTQTTFTELQNIFGNNIASMVMECTDDKSLSKIDRKKLQISHAAGISNKAKLIKLADKYANLYDMIISPPKDWSKEQIIGNVIWSYAVVMQLRGSNKMLEDNLLTIFEHYNIVDITDLDTKLNEYYSIIHD